MDNPETLATLPFGHTRHRMKTNKTQHNTEN